jgi:hypothetical protein
MVDFLDWFVQALEEHERRPFIAWVKRHRKLFRLVMDEHDTGTLAARCINYGLSEFDFLFLLWKQDGGCAICHKPYTAGKLSIDHDHQSGKVRGLLCGGCNTGLGLLRIDGAVAIERAKSVLRYVESRIEKRELTFDVEKYVLGSLDGLIDW